VSQEKASASKRVKTGTKPSIEEFKLILNRVDSEVNEIYKIFNEVLTKPGKELDDAFETIRKKIGNNDDLYASQKSRLNIKILDTVKKVKKRKRIETDRNKTNYQK
jgi:ElaB/YqjD/DUF883 family membrane-anchored ribosome-binding protein